jgi:predicted secreted Zn-dependent protease
MNLHKQQKRPSGRYLRAKCWQDLNQVTNGLSVWNEPNGISAAEEYETRLTAIWQTYQGRVKSMYQQEFRWRDERFWATAQ